MIPSCVVRVRCGGAADSWCGLVRSGRLEGDDVAWVMEGDGSDVWSFAGGAEAEGYVAEDGVEAEVYLGGDVAGVFGEVDSEDSDAGWC